MQHKPGTAKSQPHGEGEMSPVTFFVCVNPSYLSFQTVLFKFWITRLEGKDVLQSLHDCDVPRGECDLRSPFSVFCESIVFTMCSNGEQRHGPPCACEGNHFLVEVTPLLYL